MTKRSLSVLLFVCASCCVYLARLANQAMKNPFHEKFSCQHILGAPDSSGMLHLGNGRIIHLT